MSGVAERVARARELERAGKHAEAREVYERALACFAPACAEGVTPAALLRWIGSTYRAEGDGAAAHDCYTASLASAEAAGSLLDRAHALNWMGVLAHELGHADEAEACYEEAGGLAAAADDPLEWRIVQNRAVLASIQGERQRALALYTSVLERARAIGGEAAAVLLNNLGGLHLQLGHWQEARAAFDECAAVSEQSGERQLRAMAELRRVELAYLRGEHELALHHCRMAQALAAEVDHHYALGEACRWFGTLHRVRGDIAIAEPFLNDAAALAERCGNRLLAGEVQREVALLYREQDRNHEALQALSRAHAVFRELRASPLLQDVEGALRELESIYLDVVRRWSQSIEEKDRYTSGHCQRVADHACRLAVAAGVDEITLTWFRMGALLHDVGKIAIPAEVLNKNGPLNEAERAIIETHPVVGVELLASMSFPWDIRPMVRGHHERWDGQGYPDRLAGAAIPLAARILCVADVFDALTTDRPYRAGFGVEHALGIMRDAAGRMFDPELFALFEEGLRDPVSLVAAS